MTLRKVATGTLRRSRNSGSHGPLVAEHHLEAEEEHRRADDAGDARRHRHAVRQAEQDQHEAEGALAEGLDDVADG